MSRYLKFLLVPLLFLAGHFAVAPAASALSFKPSPGGPVTIPAPDEVINEIATGDLDGNGIDDLVATGDSNRIHVLLADEDGEGFAAAPGSPFGTGTSTSRRGDIFVGDFGGTDALDLLVETATFPGEFETFLGNGSGTFGQSRDFGVSPPSPAPDFPKLAGGSAVGDVNGDGLPDLVAGMTGHQFMVALGTATGQFNLTAGSPIDVPTEENGTNEMLNLAALGDWNGDGDLDAAFGLAPVIPADSPDGIYAVHGDGDGSFSPVAANPVVSLGSGTSITSLSRLDLNGDAFEDLAFATPDELSVRTLLGSSPGLVPNGNPGGTVSNLPTPNSTTVADLDGDARQDVAVTLRDNQSLTVAVNEPGGILAPLSEGPFSLPPIGGNRFVPNNLVAGDFNGDGAPDLASSSGHPAAPDRARGVDVLINSPASDTAPDWLEFPATRVSKTADPLTLTLTSAGAVPLPIEGVSVTEYGTDAYSADASDCPALLQPGEGCDIVVAFSPDSFGTQGGQLVIDFGGAAESESIPMIGETYEIEPTALAFGAAEVGDAIDRESRTVTVTTSGQMPVQKATVTGPDAASFRVAGGECASTAPTCSFGVTFDPRSGPAGPRTATLNLEGGGSDLPVAEIALTGDATDPPINPPNPDPDPDVVRPPLGGPRLTLKLKSSRGAKRGKVLVLTATVRNAGEAVAGALSIRTRASKRSVKLPKPIRVPGLEAGASVTKKLKVKVKKTARKGRLKLKVTAAAGSIKAAATRTVRVR